jgi:hypothetical protein
LTQRRLGQARLVRVDGDHVLVRPLTELLELTHGPPRAGTVQVAAMFRVP